MCQMHILALAAATSVVNRVSCAHSVVARFVIERLFLLLSIRRESGSSEEVHASIIRLSEMEILRRLIVVLKIFESDGWRWLY